MNRRRNLFIGLSAMVLAGLLVYGVYVLQIRQIELQQTVNVVVPKDFIKSGTMITADMIELKPVVKGAYSDQMILSQGEVVGQESLIPLGTREPILRWKLDRLRLMPNERQATFQIPKDYILSLASGIRAGDRVQIYLSGKDGSVRLFADEITVASVKSAGNVEVDDPKQPNLVSRIAGDEGKMYASRRDANGTIDQINLNLVSEQWLKIDEACRNKQAKLVVAFSSASIIGK